MITGDETGAYIVACDIPACAAFASFANDTIRNMHERSRADYTRAHVRTLADARGWFREQLESRTREGNTRTLERDICPFHAPGYRTLAAMQQQKQTQQKGD